MSVKEYVILGITSLLLIVMVFNLAIPTISQAQSNTIVLAGHDVLTPIIPYDTPIPLSHAPLVPNTVKVYNATYTAVNGTDYTVDLQNGTITVLSTGALLNTSTYNVSYDYYSPVYTGITKSLVGLTNLMLVLGALVIIAAVMIIRFL